MIVPYFVPPILINGLIAKTYQLVIVCLLLDLLIFNYLNAVNIKNWRFVIEVCRKFSLAKFNIIWLDIHRALSFFVGC